MVCMCVCVDVWCFYNMFDINSSTTDGREVCVFPLLLYIRGRQSVAPRTKCFHCTIQLSRKGIVVLNIEFP